MKIASKYTLIFLLIFFQVKPNYTQDTTPEELEIVINQTENDTLRCALYYEISTNNVSNNPVKGIEYAHKQLWLAKKLSLDSMITLAYLNLVTSNNNLERGDSALYFARKARQCNVIEGLKFSIHNSIGNAYNTLLNLDSAEYYYNKALLIAKDENNEKNIAAGFNNLGLVYYDMGKLQEAYQNYLEALKIFEKLGDKANQAITLNNIGLVNMDIGNDEKAIRYFEKAITINMEINDNFNLSMNYSNLGVLYKGLEKYELALEYYNKSLVISEKYGFTNDLARHYFNVGNVYLKTDNEKLAKENFLKSLKISEEQGMDIGVLYNNFQISQLEVNDGLFNDAEKRLNKVEALIEKSGMATLRTDLLERYAQLEEKRGNYRKSLDYYKKFKSYTDSMQEFARKDQIEEVQTKYETEKKTLENEKLMDQALLNKKIIQNQRLLGLVIIISLLFLVLFSIVIYRSRQRLRRAFDTLKTLNQEVVSQKEKLEEANETKDKMFSVIAHDLRAPFSSLIGFLDILTSEFEEMEDKEKKEMLEMVSNQSIKTFGLLENLLQWSMMQRGMIKLHLSHYNLFNIVHVQLMDLASRAKSKQIELVNKVPVGLEIYIDETVCKTILRNLVNNAIKFTGRGGVIKIEAIDNPDYVTIKVIDNGIGMTKEVSSDLFKSNIPVSTRGTDNETGSGLGLRIVRDFMELLKAEIKVESRPGEGSVFCLSFRKKGK